MVPASSAALWCATRGRSGHARSTSRRALLKTTEVHAARCGISQVPSTAVDPTAFVSIYVSGTSPCIGPPTNVKFLNFALARRADHRKREYLNIPSDSGRRRLSGVLPSARAIAL